MDLDEFFHRIMGHLHRGALRILKETMTGVLELSTKHDYVCKGCVLGKYSKETFPRSDSRSNGMFQLIHSYICGPISTISLRGYKYFVTFKDDYSRKTGIYFLKTKDVVFNHFQEFNALIENVTRKKIKVIHRDNGGKYTDSDFMGFCVKEGIKREWISP